MMFGTLGTVYLIHFDQSYSGRSHYLGWAPSYLGDSSQHREDGFKRRIQKHRENSGAQILGNLNRANIDWKVVMVWTKQTIETEYLMKSWKKSKQLCPVCSPDAPPVYGGIPIRKDLTYAKASLKQNVRTFR